MRRVRAVAVRNLSGVAGQSKITTWWVAKGCNPPMAFKPLPPLCSI